MKKHELIILLLLLIISTVYSFALPETEVKQIKSVLMTRTVFYIPEGTNLISLNNATKEQLMTIKGIGAKTADKIIAYRQKTPFCTIEDITNISGIGEKTYLRIRSLLCL